MGTFLEILTSAIRLTLLLQGIIKYYRNLCSCVNSLVVNFARDLLNMYFLNVSDKIEENQLATTQL